MMGAEELKMNRMFLSRIILSLILGTITGFGLVVLTVHRAPPDPTFHTAPHERTIPASDVALDTSFHPAILRHHHHRTRRWRAYQWALHQAGCWYEWGGSDCGEGFDCSGLIMAAYASVGIDLPHNTVAMIDSGKLEEISENQLRPGDLVFMYNDGHVEMWAGRRHRHRTRTFGAHEQGTQVSYSTWSNVSGFYHVIGS
jgi:cell wall-associated NlpC family hydrolase